jgi:hypothetical protein
MFEEILQSKLSKKFDRPNTIVWSLWKGTKTCRSKKWCA